MPNNVVVYLPEINIEKEGVIKKNLKKFF